MEDILNNKHKYLLVFIFFLIFWFLILIFSGVLFSGFHFQDDHEIISMQEQLSSSDSNFFSVFKHWFKIDFAKRFRPFSYISRVLEVSIFGTNFLLQSIYNGIIAVFTSFFLFIFARLIKFSILESILFVLLTKVGIHSEIWWRLGMNENEGMFVLSIALIFMALSIYATKKNILYKMLFIFFVILSSLSKESFILLIPALLFWKVWLTYNKNKMSLIQSIKKNLPCIIILFFVFAIELFIILYYIDTVFDYAGVERRIEFYRYLDTMMVLSKYGYQKIIFTSFLLAVLLFFTNRDKLSNLRLSAFIKNFIPPAVLFLLIVTPQVVLYAKSGINGRYLLPSVIGYSYLLIYTYRYINNNLVYGIKDFSIKSNKIISKFVIPVVFVFLFVFTEIILRVGYLLLFFVFVGLIYFIIYKWRMFKLRKGALIDSKSVKEEKDNKKIMPLLQSIKQSINKYSLKIILLLIIFIIILNTGKIFNLASDFSSKDRNTNNLLQSIARSTEEEDVILITANPTGGLQYEPVHSIRIYLSLMLSRENLYVYPVSLGNEDVSEYFDMFGASRMKNIENKDIISCVVLFPGIEETFLCKSKSWFKKSLFEKCIFDNYVVYYKK